VSRLATIGLSFALLIGLSASWNRLTAQDEAKKEAKQDDAKKDDAKKDDAKKDDAKKDDAKKDDAKKDDAKKDAAKKDEKKKDDEPPVVPPEVQEKLEKARKAVAEAIAAAEKAGLVNSSIDPPPILDILVFGYAIDQREYTKDAKDRVGVSPEVFGAWFSGYGKKEANPSLVPQDEVRIFQPSKGLKRLYDQKATVFNSLLEAARKAQAETAKPKEEAAKPEAAKDEKPKDEKPAEEKKEDKPKDDAPKEEKPK
jgi:hypothetical protein